MPHSKPSYFKPFLIVLLTFIAVFACIFVAMKLLSVNNLGTDTEAGTGNDTLILRAIDGDTLELSSGEIIRLLCVDTPELGKEGYDEAGEYLSSLVLSGEGDIQIERHGLDMYNRTLAWVYSGNVLINKEIIDNGYGSVFPYQKNNEAPCTCFLDAQKCSTKVLF